MKSKPKTQKEVFRAANEAVNEELRRGTWVYYEHYKIEKQADKDKAYIKAPLIPGVPRKKHEYDPLATMGLFIEFAGLAEKGDVSYEDWLDWTLRYGVLGVDWHKAPVDLYAGGQRERFSIFKEEARRANWVLRLYEAATAEDGPDEPAIKEYLGLEEGIIATPEELKRWALHAVSRAVQIRLAGYCYPRLYLRQDLSVARGEGFGSLIGAMYIQMSWLMTATEKIRRCQRPGCDRIIYLDPSALPEDPEQKARAVRAVYKSKKYCTVNCRVKRWQHNQRRLKDLENRG